MTDPFSSLAPEKQQKILNAALKEFADKGYEQASTNRIVKEAGIGKGMLFYYFKSKKELYQYLIDYCIDKITQEYLLQIDNSERDFIERYRQTAQLKLEAQSRYPEIFNFMGGIFLADEVDMSAENVSRLAETKELGQSLMYDNIDTSLFRDDVEPEMIVQLIRWFMEGYERKLLADLRGKNFTEMNLDPYWDDFFALLDTLKTIFYK